MKRLILLLCLAMSTYSFAQTSGGPDAYGYTWKNSLHVSSPPNFQWFDITTIGTQVTGLSDDNFVGPYTVPGGFNYYWYTVNQFWIGSNGYLSFASDNIASPFPTSIPLATGANDWLGINLSDLNFSGATNPATCYYYASGDTVCVSYHDVPYWENSPTGFTGSNTFQVILNKADNSITYNFLDMNLGSVTLLDNAVGIENNNGIIGLQSIIDQSPTDSLTIVYDYPSTVTYVALDAGMNWNGNDANGGIFVKRRYDTLELKTNVKNFGNAPLTSLTIDNQVLNAAAVAQTTGTTNLSMLGVGKDSTLTFTNEFTPNVSGIYTYRTTVTTTGDAVVSNNSIDQKIIAIDTNSNLMTLDYSDGIPDGTGLGWNGGGGGIAVYIEPPMYPVRIVSSRFHISANASPPVGFHALIYDDDGPNGGPGTLLDSAFRAPNSVTLNSYNTVSTSNNNLMIMDGGVYLFWLMDGAGINISRDITQPISRRTYEVLFGGWATYRDFLTEDFLMGINTVKVLPKANFTSDASNDPTVVFTDRSTNNPDQWRWNFGDGSPIDTNQNPTHTYASIDTFRVCLSASNFAGTDSICKDVPILNIPPEVDFSIADANAPTIAFSDLSTNNPNKWHWDFGDGDTADTKNVTHTYLSNGTFNVCLTASNQAGPGATLCKDVEITQIGVGIKEGDYNEALKVYPNPSSDVIYIELNSLPSSRKVVLNCHNLSGQRVELAYQVSNNQISFDVSKLSPGTYLFEVFNLEDKIGSGRFIVK